MISGAIRWDFRKRRKNRLELVLLWFTEGVGNTDVGIVATQIFSEVSALGERNFELRAPQAPESFRGKLIRLRWAIEIKSDHHELDRAEFDLTSLPEPLNFENGLPTSS